MAAINGRRAKRMSLVVVGGAVVLTTSFLPISSAMADEITFQDSNVVNAGGAFANSGGNVAIGNASTNVAATGQGAAGGIASNSADTSNTSNGTASITTGAATATGSVADNDVDQSVHNGGDDGGLTVGVQDSDTVNVGVAGANSGLNGAVGNASTNLAGTGQGALGGLAVNNANTSNSSNGTAAIVTGPATATGTASSNDVDQKIHTGVEDGLAVLVQDADVINLGAGFANSGGNFALGNVSTNIAGTGQGALGLVALNNASTGNTSNGTATIATGAATAVGNLASNAVDQDIHGPDDDLLTVLFQDALAVNIGVGLANSGLNAAVGNLSFNAGFVGQGLAGLIAHNVSELVNSSDGAGLIATGAATGTGNKAENDITQNS